MISKFRIDKIEEEALIDHRTKVSLMKSTTFETPEIIIDGLEELDLIIIHANGQEM